MKLKIMSNGTAKGTRVFEKKSGKPVKGLRSVSWRIDMRREMGVAVVHLDETQANLIGETEGAQSARAEKTKSSEK